MYRQGDLLFIRTDASPTGELQKTRDVLGSSVTGHTHKVTKGRVYVNRDIRWDARYNFFVELPEGADLVHEEHGTIPLPPGNYEVIRQRETTGYVRD